MSQPPILVLQMQRMGDLVLTFPLLALLQRRYPGHPIWTVAEPRFFQELQPFSPPTVFFPPEARRQLETVQYRAVINLSHRADAAALAGSVNADQRFGAYDTAGGRYIDGYWSLYRASIVHNNRHNLYHWGNLHLLDHCPATLPHFDLSATGQAHSPSERVGIFVGASEKEKRPSPQFLGELGAALLRKGLRPLFLGGPDDVELGREAQRVSGIAGSNVCGRYSVAELAAVLRSLALLVTPDTGPMHLAAWLGTPVLNLSLGPVNAWETGPLLPGQYVLRPRLSCSGCWQCPTAQPRCHGALHAGRVALVVHTLLVQRGDAASTRLQALRLPGLSLARTGRDARGLYTLESVLPEIPSHRMLLARFWQEWFWNRQGDTLPTAALEAAAAALAAEAPALTRCLARHLPRMGKEIAHHLPHTARQGLAPAFWQSLPPLLRPFSGHMQLRLQNAEYAPQAWEAVLGDMALLARLFPATR